LFYDNNGERTIIGKDENKLGICINLLYGRPDKSTSYMGFTIKIPRAANTVFSYGSNPNHRFELRSWADIGQIWMRKITTSDDPIRVSLKESNNEASGELLAIRFRVNDEVHPFFTGFNWPFEAEQSCRPFVKELIHIVSSNEWILVMPYDAKTERTFFSMSREFANTGRGNTLDNYRNARGNVK
jgi:hypothetical protein